MGNVETGVALVGEAGGALERISGKVSEINRIVTEIASAASEQATGLREVNLVVGQMDKATQQNAAMVEETTAASKTLAGETENLVRLVGQFDVGQVSHDAGPPAKRPAAPATVTALRTGSSLAC